MRTRAAKTPLSALCLLLLLITGSYLARESSRRTDGSTPADFAEYYVASWRLRHDQPLYTPTQIDADLQHLLGWTYSSNRPANPPPMMILTGPLSYLPYKAAWFCLFFFSLLSIGGTTWLVSSRCGWSTAVSRCLAALAICSMPALVLLVLNHVEAVILLLLAAGWCSLENGRLRFGGSLWGLAAALKLFPAFWLLPLFSKRHKEAAFAGAASAAVLSLGSAFIAGKDNVAAFFYEVIPQSAVWSASEGNFSLLIFGTRFFSSSVGWVLEGIAALFLCRLFLMRECSAKEAMIFGVAGSLLLSPLSWSYYFILLIPALIVLGSALDFSKRRDTYTMLALVLSLLFWPTLLGGWGLTDMLPADNKAEAVFSTLINFVPTFGLLGLILFTAAKKPRL